MLNNDFIKTEMLADDYINQVVAVKELLAQGKTAECLTLLAELESAMQITLALGERYDLKMIN